MPEHVFFIIQDYVLVLNQDAENVDAGHVDNQAAGKQEAGYSGITE